MDKDYTFDEVSQLDSALQNLALYEVCHGMMIFPRDIEGLMDLQQKMADKFNEFKHLIKKGEMKFEDIKRDVLKRNGPFQQEKSDLDIESLTPVHFIEKKTDTFPTQNQFYKPSQDIGDFWNDMLSALDGLAKSSNQENQENKNIPPIANIPEIQKPESKKKRTYKKRKPKNGDDGMEYAH